MLMQTLVKLFLAGISIDRIKLKLYIMGKTTMGKDDQGTFHPVKESLQE
jgi:hypothetical protein